MWVEPLRRSCPLRRLKAPAPLESARFSGTSCVIPPPPPSRLWRPDSCPDSGVSHVGGGILSSVFWIERVALVSRVQSGMRGFLGLLRSGRRVRWLRRLKAIFRHGVFLLGLQTQTLASSDSWPAAAVCVLLPEIACAPLFPRDQGGIRGISARFSSAAFLQHTLHVELNHQGILRFYPSWGKLTDLGTRTRRATNF